jgi:DNA polymerase-3 subunit alpha (Gram-positive type)
MLKSIQKLKAKNVKKEDLASEKRVELHTHTKMSVMDGVSTSEEYLKKALEYGHSALALTDHNNVQAYPDAYNYKIWNAKDLKLIYGMETNLIDDEIKITFGSCDYSLDDATYVFFDFETTGLSANDDEIIEIGAVKYRHGMEVESFQSFVKPKQKVSLYIKSLTGITDEHLNDAPNLADILPDFVEFYQDCVLVAHNATFDIGFLEKALILLDLPKLNNCVIDTMQLSRVILKERKYHNLGSCARAYYVRYDMEIAHRADYDALILAQVFEGMKLDLSRKYQIDNLARHHNHA